MNFKETVIFDGWSYGMFLPEQIKLKDEARANFLKLWLSKKPANHLLPSRKDFSFEDFKDLYGWVSVEQIIYDPFDIKINLHGEQLTDLDICDLTGKNISAFLSDPLEGEHLKIYLNLQEQAAKNNMITRSWGRQIRKSRSVGVDWISFPCAADSTTTSHFISIGHTCMLSEVDSINS